MTQNSNNKRIAKNTLLLYVRMLVSMFLSLYVSRLVLEELGVEDFGIYNIVGGIVIFFSFLNNALSTATERFLNYELGKNELDKVSRVFSVSMTVHIGIAVILLLFAETIGLWFMNTSLNISNSRIIAANWVYQFSVLSAIISVVVVPYNAIMIAYERMFIYSYIGVVEAVLKFALVFMLYMVSGDKLIIYSGLLLFATLIVGLVRIIYCNKCISTVKRGVSYDKKILSDIINFSGWSLFGGFANVCNSQGINVLMNIFIGVSINAGIGIANQVNMALYQLVSNFQIAFKPQIVKLYSSGDRQLFLNLLLDTSKYSFFLMWTLSLPILINTEYLLSLWLVEVPPYTVNLLQWIVAYTLIEALSGPLWMSIQAGGDIKYYQIIISIFIISNLPIAYFVLYYNYNPIYVFMIRFGINIITLFWRVYYLKKKVGFPSELYLRDVLKRIVFVVIPSLPFWLIASQISTGWIVLVAKILLSILFSIIPIWFFGLTRNERDNVTGFFKRKIKNMRRWAFV